MPTCVRLPDASNARQARDIVKQSLNLRCRLVQERTRAFNLNLFPSSTRTSLKHRLPRRSSGGYVKCGQWWWWQGYCRRDGAESRADTSWRKNERDQLLAARKARFFQLASSQRKSLATGIESNSALFLSEFYCHCTLVNVLDGKGTRIRNANLNQKRVTQTTGDHPFREEGASINLSGDQVGKLVSSQARGTINHFNGFRSLAMQNSTNFMIRVI